MLEDEEQGKGIREPRRRVDYLNTNRDLAQGFTIYRPLDEGEDPGQEGACPLHEIIEDVRYLAAARRSYLLKYGGPAAPPAGEPDETWLPPERALREYLGTLSPATLYAILDGRARSRPWRSFPDVGTFICK